MGGEAALRYVKNVTVTGNDQTNIETLEALGDTVSNTLVKCTLNAYERDEYPQRGRTVRR